jgi:8-oxo-dGTP pyrophosphatase MutT (NUDIX family)
MSKKQERAGLIPFFRSDDDQVHMMFMMPSDEKYGGKVFQIAKGRVDPGENPFQAAVREANEELGLKEQNIKWVKKCGKFLSTHHIYIAEVSTMSDSDYDDPCFETGETKWMTLEEYLESGRTLHVPIVKECFKLFENQPYDT